MSMATVVSLSRVLRPIGSSNLSFSVSGDKLRRVCGCLTRFSSQSFDYQKGLVVEVKERLERNYGSLPVGKNGRDDDDMILWFLKDRGFAVDETVMKLVKAIKWRQEFNVSGLTEASVSTAAETGKAYVHNAPDVYGRPVLFVVASKHFPDLHDSVEDQKLCAFLIEKALSQLPPGKEQILGIFDLRNFGLANADINFMAFIFDVLYYYYPKRLSQVLFVDAPFVFQPIWQLAKPVLKSYASLVRFCSTDTLRQEYFTAETLPSSFRLESDTV